VTSYFYSKYLIPLSITINLTTNLSAETINVSDLKPNGVSIIGYQHTLDLKVIRLETTLPNVSPQELEEVKNQLDALNKVEVISLQLDRQILPYLNIFASIGKLNDITTVDFKRINPFIPNLITEDKGVIYGVGATLLHQRGKFIGSLQYLHSRIDFNNNDGEIIVNSLVPTLGYQTRYGLFNTSLLYQKMSGQYSGTLTAPIVGDIAVNIKTKNKNPMQFTAGYARYLTNDIYLLANIGLNGHKQFHFQLNKRF
jgi:hypothetical protein